MKPRDDAGGVTSSSTRVLPLPFRTGASSAQSRAWSDDTCREDVRWGRERFRQLARTLFGAAALFVAGLASPAAAAAAARVHAASPSAAVTAASWSPNLIKLPDEVHQKIDDFALSLVKDLRAVVEFADQQINDPWSIEDVWLIVVWHFAIKSARQPAFRLTEMLRKRKDENDVLPEDSAAWEAAFKDSFWDWVKGPMRVIGALWITLYLFDNAVRIGTLLEIGNILPGTMMAQFDRGMYTLASGIILVMSTNQWLPAWLEAKGIEDTSQRLVITRIMTLMLVLGTVNLTALVFGVPGENLLGFGGIQGLAFGLAAKDLISNFIGGSMLAVMRPFSPGEKIFLMSVNGRFRGTNDPSVGGYLVKEVGWYQTTLIPKDTRPTTVPNGYFLGANVINITRQSARVIVVELRVRFDDAPKVPIMTQEITTYLRMHDAIVKGSRPIRVHLRGVKEDHLSIRVECHSHVVKKEPFLDVQQEVILGILDVVRRYSSGPAWPVLNVNTGEDERPWKGLDQEATAR